jgi:hypothetical protein
MEQLTHTLAAAVMAALLVAGIVRAARPGHLLAFLRPWYQALLIRLPLWLPSKLAGECYFCMAFWLPGVPVAVLAATLGGVGWWALTVPLLIAFLTEKLLSW